MWYQTKWTTFLWKQKRLWSLLLIALVLIGCINTNTPEEPKTTTSAIPDKPWVEAGTKVTVDLKTGTTSSSSNSAGLSIAATSDDVNTLSFEGKSIPFEKLGENSISFSVPDGVSSGVQEIEIKAGNETIKTQVNVPGNDLLKGAIMLVTKREVSQENFASKLNSSGYTLETFKNLGSSDNSSICSGNLVTIGFGEDKDLSQAVFELSTSIAGDLFDLSKLANTPDSIPLNVIDPRSTYGVRAATHLDTIGARVAQNRRGLSGAGTTIAVLDTGVAAHSELTGRLVAGADFVDDDNNPVDTFDDPATNYANDGHGTAVAVLAAGEKYGVAPQAKVMPVRVCGDDGKCDSSDIVRGMCYALNNAEPGKLVMNLSLGGETPPFIPEFIMYEAVQKKVLIAAAAGNRGEDGSPKHYPAAYNLDGVVVAAALDETNTKAAPFSNAGTYIDIAAPGMGIESGTPGGDYYSSYQGTSFATGLVAGALALWREAKPNETVRKIEEDLISAATSLGDEEGVGGGLLNLSEQPVPPPPPEGVPIINSLTASPSSILPDQSVKFSWEIDEEDGDPVSCTLDVGDTNAPFPIENCLTTTTFEHIYTYGATFTATLRATDRDGTSRRATTVIVSDNPPPVAEAGSDQTVTIDSTVQLDGSGSSDPDGEDITYAWVLSKKPDSSQATLDSKDTAKTSFFADVEGEYEAELTVSDGEFTSSDAVKIKVIPGGTLCEGNFTVDGEDTEGDIALVKGCGTIEGYLSIQGIPLSELTLENLSVIKKQLVIANNSSLKQLSLPALQSIGRSDSGGRYLTGLTVDSNGVLPTLNLPKLESVVGDIDILRNGVLSEISFGNLATTGRDIYVAGNPLLKTVKASKLSATPGYLHFENNAVLDSVAMDSLTDIDGYLYLGGNGVLQSFTLPSLSTIKKQLTITTNGSLSNITFPNLQKVGRSDSGGRYLKGLTVDKNGALPTLTLPNLVSVEGDIDVLSNGVLTEINFENLAATGRDVYITSNSSLKAIKVSKLGTAPGYLHLETNTSLDSIAMEALTGIDGYLYLGGNGAIENFGLPNLVNIKKQLTITSNGVLKSIALPNLQKVGRSDSGGRYLKGLTVDKNGALPTLTLPNLVSVEGDIDVLNNELLEEFKVENLVNTGRDIYILSNPSLTTVTASKLGIIPGYLNINTNTALSNLDMSSLTNINDYLYVGNNDALVTLSLPSLTNIATSLHIDKNTLLQSVNLSKLTSISGGFKISSNDTIENLSGFGRLKTLSGELDIRSNGALLNLSGLDNLTTVSGNLIISSNSSLQSLAGLESLNTVGGTETISSNAVFDCTSYNSGPPYPLSFFPVDASTNNLKDCVVE